MEYGQFFLPPKELGIEGNRYDRPPEMVKKYFEWYIKEIPNRMKIFQEYLDSNNANVVLDYSEESLSKLWSYMVDITEYREIREDELKEYYPEGFYTDEERQELKKEAKTITTKTQLIALDVGAYFGEVLIRNNPTLRWDYFTKPNNHMDANTPVIVMFTDATMDPTNIVRNCLWRNNKNRLMEVYYIWKKKVLTTEYSEYGVKYTIEAKGKDRVFKIHKKK